LMFKGPQNDSLALSVGVRSSFVAEEDTSKPQDTDNESSSSEFEIPDLRKQMCCKVASNTTKEGTIPISKSGSNNAATNGQDTGENGLQNGRYLEKMLIPMFGNIKIDQSAHQPRQSPNFFPSRHEVPQPHSRPTQNFWPQPKNHEQHLRLNDQQQNDKLSPVQQHANQVSTSQHQQPGLGDGQQNFQFPVVDARYVPVYQQQVQPSPSPQPPVYQLTPPTPQYGQSLLIQPSPLVTPKEYGPNGSNSTTPTDQQQYPWQEVSCSDTQSVSSVGSSYPSAVSTPVYQGTSTPAYQGTYYDPNLVNQFMISPLSTQGYPSSQMITNIYPSYEMPPFYLNNAQGCSIPNNMECNINQMTEMRMPSSIPRQPHLELETAPANTHINIAPPWHRNTKSRSSLASKGRDSSIYTKSFNYAEQQHPRHSNLYVNWAGTADQLRGELEQRSLEVHSIFSTTVRGLWNVVFDLHSSARKAFTTQREIKIRMVPPRRSKKNWFRNPSPKFLVQYETKCRLDVRQGKAVVHDLVGVLLMSRSSSQERKGCYIWADQLKGHRIRIVGCVGKFMFPTKRVIDMKEIPQNPVGNAPIGWVSYRNRHTREEYVTRISGNLLQEYIYNGDTDFNYRIGG